jgi:hypothetical protein
MRCDCINGYAVGRKRKGGQVKKDVCVTVFVNKKLNLRRLPVSNRIPKTFALPSERSKDGVLEFTTDVQEARFSSLEHVERQRPAPSGISIGHINITAGTLGGLVRDRETGNVVILSNNHVLADSNEAVAGDPILQPGPHDGGTNPADQIATLTRFVAIDFSEGAENRVDGAIAMRRVLGESDLGDFVRKSGRTTEHTQGFVQAMFATVSVKYDLFKKATFVDQIIVSQPPAEEPFSNGGDSGSLVYDAESRVVGLLFAGSEGSETEPATTIINPINYVMNQLNVELLNAGDHPAAVALSSRRRAAKKTRRSSKQKR